MRTDVKLGMGISMALVLIVGGYFTFRGDEAAPITVSESPAASPAGPASKPAATAKQPAPRNARNSSNRPSGSSIASNAAPRVSPNTNPSATPKAGDPASSLTAGTGGKPAIGPVPDRGLSSEQTMMASAPDRTASPLTPGEALVRTPTGQLSADAAGSTGRADVGSAAPSALSSPADPARVDSGSSKQPTSSAAVEIHRAQPGDTLVSLAQAYYGSATYVSLLREANPHVTDASRIPPGTSIKIPAARPAAPTSSSATTERTAADGKAATSGPPGKRTYTVQPGDSFYRIAEKQLGNAGRWRELMTLNSTLVNGDPLRLRPGQVVVLPGS